MQPHYLNSDFTRSLLQLQPYLVPLVKEQKQQQQQQHQAFSKPHKSKRKLHFTILVIVAVLLCSGVGMDGMKNFGKYLRSLKWTPLPVGIGLTVVAVQRYKYVRRREEAHLANSEGPCIAQPWEVSAYKMLPLRHISRVWGWVNDIYLPLWCRRVVLTSYVNTFGCNMKEAEQEDISEYSCLSSLFRRSLKPNARPISQHAALTSPVDGTVLAVGPVNCGTLHQIKGVKFPMRKFLGPNVWGKEGPMLPLGKDMDACYHKRCLKNPETSDLYQIVVYLAPGDYHRFHSPANWQVKMRRHFPGELLSVNPSFAAWLPNLFVLNERVLYVGDWRGGFCSMTAVGATNVGSIKVYKDEQLETNKALWRRGDYVDKSFKGIRLTKGEAFGEFNLGSTVVLIVEVPKDGVRLECEPGNKIKMGQPLITFIEDEAPVGCVAQPENC